MGRGGLPGRAGTSITADHGEHGSDLEVLLGLVARGDQAAFEAVCRLVTRVVFGVVRAVVRDPCQAEEVCQEVLLEIWRCASRFEQGRGSALAWVTTIAHRRAVDRVRAEQRAADRQRRAFSHDIAYDKVAEQVEARLDRERVRRCLGSLTDLQRESVTLAYYGGYTFREVAVLLGVAEGTAKTRMRDGLIRLRDCLQPGARAASDPVVQRGAPGASPWVERVRR
jgi:RNA polymerase sigma-70 factor, ECF subfamily